MTLIGSTNRTSSYNRSSEGPDWKRRSERLVRATGRPYTIVRPGWFDYNGPDDQLPVLLQGDLRRSGRPSDGAISRRQIAQVLGQQLPARAATDPPGLRGPAVTPVAGDSPAGAAHLALRRQARTQGRNTEELLQLYVLEGFLARLSSSTLRERFVLKGGVLLALSLPAAPHVTSTSPPWTSETTPTRSCAPYARSSRSSYRSTTESRSTGPVS
jgi:hypothetical protein